MLRKDVHWSSCLTSCTPGVHEDDPIEYQTPWSCHEVGTPTPSPTPVYTGDWIQGLVATHFWDCNGAACDAATLQPWNIYEYKYSPQYAPLDPNKYGGSAYGERMWMTGAASDALSAMLGPDSDCCGADSAGGGGCGKCLLVRNPSAVQADWTAVVMKKNRCPPWSHGCDKPHLDIAVPAHDNLQYSTANICGDPARSSTYITKEQSGLCGGQNPGACDCNKLPGDTPAQRMIKFGCHLFRSWGWTSGKPTLEYKPVACPAGFTNLISDAFGVGGVNPTYIKLVQLDEEAAPSSFDVKVEVTTLSRTWLLSGFAVALMMSLACLGRIRYRSGEQHGQEFPQVEGSKECDQLMTETMN